MKRVFTLLLVVVLLVGALSATAMSYAQAALQMVGDINGDGQINNRDLGQLQQYLNMMSVNVEGGADLNNDNKVNNQDLGLLQQMLVAEVRVPMMSTATTYVSLGAPAEQYYPNNRLARCAWDMTIFGGRLYVGCGDYSKNPGDAPILSAPLSNPTQWTLDTRITDEQVGRFVNINGVLTIPGFDPVGSPVDGSFYELIDGEWQKREVLPYGFHNFDVVWFQGRMYAAVGADRGCYPIAYTEDGVNYETLPMYKNGELLDTGNSNVVRTSNLYVLGEELYADFWYEDEAQSRAVFEMYHYNPSKDCFEYVADLKTSTHGGLYSPAHLPIWEKKAVNDKMFLTTGYLFYTTDFQHYTQVSMPNDAVVYDMQTFGGRLYLLTAYADGKQYKVNIYSTTASDPSDLRTEASFSYALAPTAFALDANNFFIGMGNWYGTGSAGNGTILQMKR